MKPNRPIINDRTARLARSPYQRPQKPAARNCKTGGISNLLPTLQTQTILLLSHDAKLHEDLRSLANALGRIVVRVSMPGGVIPVLQAVNPSAVLLDLDLPGEASWGVAELLLRQPNCPALILITARHDQFDLRTAIRAGSLIDKSQGPARLLEVVEEILAMPASVQAERNGIQRVLIHWLRPTNWQRPPERPYSRWRIEP